MMDLIVARSKYSLRYLVKMLSVKSCEKFRRVLCSDRVETTVHKFLMRTDEGLSLESTEGAEDKPRWELG